MAHDQEVVGSNPCTPYIKRKLKIKVAKWGTPKNLKKIKKIIIFDYLKGRIYNNPKMIFKG
jgi:hypothetical protein